jgi:hypothetical protein
VALACEEREYFTSVLARFLSCFYPGMIAHSMAWQR